MNDPRLLSDEEFLRILRAVEDFQEENEVIADRQARIEQAEQLKAQILDIEQDRDLRLYLASQREEQRDATIAVLRVALEAALTEIPYDIIECGGSKCRLSVCASCWGDGAGPPDMSGFNAALSDPAPRAEALLRVVAASRATMTVLKHIGPPEGWFTLRNALAAWDGTEATL